MSTIPSTPGPSKPLTCSYTYHSPLPTEPGPYILGVDEAGRGPVLGPLVYGVAYCPESFKDEMEELGFDDSKALNAETRSSLLETLSSHPDKLGWSVRVISPQAISNGMLRIPPINLNKQSQEATILLIREVLDKGIQLSSVYVDALGDTSKYETYLSSVFPGISFTVTTKADSKFKIVGAASVAAKVTRDACIEDWVYEEPGFVNDSEDASEGVGVGSGYPSDPKTKAWLKKNLNPVFGFPRIVRFSWATVKVLLLQEGKEVKWIDEGQASLIQAFGSGTGLDKDRSALAKDLSLRSISAF